MEQSTKMLGRLALRHEGTFWTAYYALPGTMDGAVLLGSIAMRFVVDAPARRLVFMELMREAVADMLEEQLGSRPQWCGPEVAPESERAGHG